MERGQRSSSSANTVTVNSQSPTTYWSTSEPTRTRGPIRVTFAERRSVGKTICGTTGIFIRRRSPSSVRIAEKDFVSHERWPYTKWRIWRKRLTNVRSAVGALISVPIWKPTCRAIQRQHMPDFHYPHRCHNKDDCRATQLPPCWIYRNTNTYSTAPTCLTPNPN